MAENKKPAVHWFNNVFKLPLILRIVRLPVYPYILQVGAFCCFILFIYFGWGRPVFEFSSPAELLYRKLNFTTFVVWGLWWTSMIWITFFLGRAWCHVCPLELIMNIAERLGRRLGIPQRMFPRVLRNGILILTGYLIVQFAVSCFHIHRAPHYAATFLISLAVISFIFGFFFKYRSFCSFVCPVGILLNCYSRCAPVELRTIDGEVCDQCKTRDCLSLKTYEKWDRRGCPSLLNPPRLNSNKDCLLCLQCVKACPRDNFRFGVRKFFADIVADEKTGLILPLFLVIITGFMTYELTLNNAVKEIFLTVPAWAAHLRGAANPYWKGFFKGMWVLVVFPSIIWLTFAALFRLLSHRKSLLFYFKTYAVSFIPILVAAHLSKALDKWNAWLKGIRLPFNDPFGVETFAAIYLRDSMTEPGKIIAPNTLRWLPLLILAVGAIVTVYKITQVNTYLTETSGIRAESSRIVPFIMALFISFIFLFNVWIW